MKTTNSRVERINLYVNKILKPFVTRICHPVVPQTGNKPGAWVWLLMPGREGGRDGETEGERERDRETFM